MIILSHRVLKQGPDSVLTDGYSTEPQDDAKRYIDMKWGRLIMTSYQFIWFLLIGVLFSGFFFLEGFDFGIGMSVRFFAKNLAERDTVIQTIGPHWDGNEVWLITAGGAMFASFPMWYASRFQATTSFCS